MSHSSAQFHFSDGTELHGEYDGTSDVMLPLMFNTPEERNAQWRNQDWGPHPWDICPHEYVECVVHSDYGGGFSWKGKACIPCMRYLGPFEEFELDANLYSPSSK